MSFYVLTRFTALSSSLPTSNVAVKRRNKWICALKTNLAELKIYGPSGNPNAPPSVDRYTEVPWEVMERKDQEAYEKDMLKFLEEEERKKAGHEWKLGDKNTVLSMFHGIPICPSFLFLEQWILQMRSLVKLLK